MQPQTVGDVQPNTREEVVQRLPGVADVGASFERELVRVFCDVIPPSFWLVRASASHHPPDERGVCGNWLHTCRVYTAYEMLHDTFRALGYVDQYEAMCGRTAVLLHDGFRYGRDPAKHRADDTDGGHDYCDALDHLPQYSVSRHDLLMAEFVRDQTGLPEEVASAIESHGGSTSWSGSHEGPSPDTPLDHLVHYADVLASNSTHRLPVDDPHPCLQQVIEQS